MGLHLVLRLRGGGKVHGSLARAGKVKGQTPKVQKQDKKKLPTGRAKKRMQYNRRFVNVVNGGMGKRVGPNNNAARLAREAAADPMCRMVQFRERLFLFRKPTKHGRFDPV